MTTRAAVLLSLALLTTSCQRPDPPPPAAAPPKQGRHDAGSGITVEAEWLPPEAKQAVAEWTKGLLTDAVHRVIQEGVDELYQKLKISDDVERQLLGGRYDWGGPDEENDTWSIFLLRPGDPARPPETIELLKAGWPVIRFTRAFAAVERPVATMTRSRASQGRVTQAVLFLTYSRDGKWEVARPAVKQESLRLGGR